jgi:hypothetical protein
LIIIGDSHVRSHTKSKRLSAAIFVGSGKEINLINNVGLINYILRLYALKYSGFLSTEKGAIVMIVGEPDIRYAAYGSWYPHLQRQDELQSQKLLDNSINRCEVLLNFTKRLKLNLQCIIGVGTPNQNLDSLAAYFNKKLEVLAKKHQLLFFDSQAIFSKAENKARYIGHSAFSPEEKDEVHLGHNISQDFDYVLSDSRNKEKDSEKDICYFSSIFVSIKYYEKFLSHRVRYCLVLRLIFRLLEKFNSALYPPK